MREKSFGLGIGLGVRERKEDGSGLRGFHDNLERWRKSLCTVFVDNVSYRISWRELKVCFDEFGIMVDVFIPNRTWNRHSNYGFVRFLHEHEMRKAIQYGEGIHLNGLKLKVKEAYRDRQRKKVPQREVMEVLLQSYSEIFNLWFDYLVPYDAEVEMRREVVETPLRSSENQSWSGEKDGKLINEEEGWVHM
ncbi:RNA recognition motif domain - like 10 [Theobroma cacao]|nr:RNA recognition motif domain - like 10 [Theobroma cacao]